MNSDADTLTVSPGTYSPVIYNWVAGQRVSLAVHANGGDRSGGLRENVLYWVASNSYDAGTNLVTLTLSESESGPPVDITSGFTGSPSIIETQLLPGPGTFTETITFYAGQKSVVIEDEGDSPVEYFLNFLQPGFFTPNRAQYRPHHVSCQDCGYELQNGEKVPYSGRSSAVDVFIDVDVSTDKDADDCWCNERKFSCLALWNMPTMADTSWYWLFYDKDASAESPLIGFYEGRISRLHRIINTGPGMFTSPAHFSANGTPAAGINMTMHFRGHNLWSTQWGRDANGGFVRLDPIRVAAARADAGDRS